MATCRTGVQGTCAFLMVRKLKDNNLKRSLISSALSLSFSAVISLVDRSLTSKQKNVQNAHSSSDSKISTKDLTSGEYRAVTPMPPIDEVKELSPHGSDSLINKALEYNGLSPNYEQNGVAPSSTQFGRASPSNLSRMSTRSQNDEISYTDQNLINSQTELLQNEEGALSDSDNMTYQTHQTTDSAEESTEPVPSPNTVAMLEEETWATVVETDGGGRSPAQCLFGMSQCLVDCLKGQYFTKSHVLITALRRCFTFFMRSRCNKPDIV